MNNQIKFNLNAAAIALSLFVGNAFAAQYSSTDLAFSAGAPGTHYFSSGAFKVEFDWSGSELTLRNLNQGLMSLPASQTPERGSVQQSIPDAKVFASEYSDEIAELTKEISNLESHIKANPAPLPEEGKPARMTREQEKLAKLERQKLNAQRSIDQLMRYPVFNLTQVLSTLPKEKFFLETRKGVYLVKSPAKQRQTLNNALSRGSSHGLTYSYHAEKVMLRGSKQVRKSNERVLSMDTQSGYVLGFELEGSKFSLDRVYDDKVKEYELLAKRLPTEVTKFDFKGQQLYAKYQQQTSSGFQTLDVNYRYTGKKKNLVQVTASAPANVFDPKNKFHGEVSHLGILFANSKKVLEIKKQERIEKRVDSEWELNLKSRLIRLGSSMLAVEDIEYYGWEALWYLASWMELNSVSEKKINLITGSNTTGFTLLRKRQTGGSLVVVERSGAPVYEFDVSKAGLIREYRFVPYDQALKLVSMETTKTRENRKKLNDFVRENALVAVGM